MKKTVSVLLSAVLFFCTVISASAKSESSELRFSDDGTFKILVLSDTQDDQAPAYDMINCITLAIKEAEPDLIVFDGDLVEDSRIGDIGIDGEPLREGVVVKNLKGDVDIEKTLANIKIGAGAVLDVFEKSGIPFALAQGNNDHKCSISNKDWLDIYSQYGNCLAADESDDADDRIDYHLEIKGKSGKSVFNIWMIDSGRGGVNGDQIEWYKNKAADLKAANNGECLPAILFQHIPTADIGNLFEECKMYDEGATAKDFKFYRLNKEIASGRNFYAYVPGQTSDEFKAWKETGDVIGAFFGHQHVDGFSGSVDGIELGFVYGSEFAKPGPYGYTLITLHENDIKNFDSEIYTYEGKVKLGTAHFEKQIDNGYKVYDNSFEKIFAGIKNTCLALVSVITSLF